MCQTLAATNSHLRPHVEEALTASLDFNGATVVVNGERVAITFEMYDGCLHAVARSANGGHFDSWRVTLRAI